ncbi:MAG TPA: hypothetical protein PKY77_09560 [Phycisphaerae bacterium]|nr:hypothetical protein [Phycisphaerae bacterium]HRY69856.1 hypothetical protein [Phycisphaerae bacterium]HSA25417.1 hypothetical protein [Phycisphaerae bacterium]
MSIFPSMVDDSRQSRAAAGRWGWARVVALSLLGSTVLVMVGTAARAQAPDSQPAGVEQRASDQAFQELVDEVMAIRLAGGWTVGGLLGVVPDADRGLRESLLESKVEHRARPLPGNLVEVEVSLPMERLAEMLQDIAARFFPKADRSVVEIESRGRPSLGGVGRVRADRSVVGLPVGWRHCDEGQLALVRAAAETDLRQHLLERVGQWRLTPTQTVGQLWGRFPAFRQSVGRRVRAVALPKAVYEPAGICRVSDEIGRTDVLQILIRGAEDSGDPIEADLTRAVDPEFQDPLILDGFAVAPAIASSLPGAAEVESMAGRPVWVERTLSVKVTGQPPANVAGREARRRMAAGAAGIEARRQLWLQVEQLPLPGGINLDSLLAHLGRPADAISAIESTIQQTEGPSFDEQDNATVTFTARLDIIWEIARGIWPAKDAGREAG